MTGDPGAAYLLPVNMGADGNPALDANGNPLYKRDAAGNIIIGADNKPVVDGFPVDLTLVIEKYLTSLGGQVNTTNLHDHRISLVNPLPARWASRSCNRCVAPCWSAPPGRPARNRVKLT